MSPTAYSEPERTELLATRRLILIDYGFSPGQADLVIEERNDGRNPLLNRAETFRAKLAILEDYGFSRKQIARMIAKKPSILGLSKDTLENRLRNLEEYGFSRDQIVKIIAPDPSVLGQAVDTVDSKLRNLEKVRNFHNGFRISLTREEVRACVLSFPGILGHGEHTVGWKLRVMAILTEGNKQEMLEMGKKWMQSVRKTAARARFLQRHDHEWRHTRNVFLGSRNFERKFRVRL